MGGLMQTLGLGGATPTPPVDPNAAAAQAGATPPASGAAPPTPPTGAVPPPAAGAPPSAMPTTFNAGAMGNIPMPQQSILDNPWLHGLLAMYGGFAGSPRARGLGGAIQAGLGGGMQAYDAARAAQYTPYKTMAELQRAGAETQASQAMAQLNTMKAQQIANIKAQNQDVGMYLQQRAEAETDPDMKKALTLQAGIVMRDTTKGYNAAEAMKGSLDAANMAKSRAQIGLIGAQQGLAEQRKVTEADKPKLMESEIGLHGAQAALANQAAQVLKTGKPMSDADIERSGNEAATQVGKGLVEGTLEGHDAFQKRVADAQKKAYSDRVNMLRQQRQQLQTQTGQIVSGAIGGAAGGGGTSSLPGGFSEEPIEGSEGSSD